MVAICYSRSEVVATPVAIGVAIQMRFFILSFFLSSVSPSGESVNPLRRYANTKARYANRYNHSGSPLRLPPLTGSEPEP